MTITTEHIKQTLLEINDPVTGKGIVEAGMVKGLQVSDNNDVVFLISIDPKMGAKMEPLRQEAENAVREIKNVGQVSVILTAEKKAAAPDPHGMNKNPPLKLPFKRIIAVASGKGGVGKSTIAANLAVALAKKGEKVGLLDADIYGPSIPNLMGIEGQKPALADTKKLIPIMAHGVGVMSIGLMIAQDAPMIWRGPMVQSAIYQLLRDVDWDAFDTLIIDMPPGTGDAQLTLAQKIDVTGAIIVSTSQDLALLDARKAIEMFKKTDVPVMGIIENMSVHVCTNCGHEDHIFGLDKVRAEADLRTIPFLASIPLSHETRDGLNDLCQSLLSDILP
jgi:ATP-binding protein involved in chromosome partitioning